MSIKRLNHHFSMSVFLRRRGAGLFLVGILLAVHVWRPMLALIADEWEDARAAVMARYQDESILEQSRTTDAAAAREQLAGILDLIDTHFYEPISWRDVARRALVCVQAASQTEAVDAALGMSSTQKTSLQAQLRQLQAELASGSESAWTTREVERLTDELQSLTQSAGGNDAWALIEWSYALAENLDSYSYLLSPRQYQAMQERLGGAYMGIGIDVIVTGEYPRLFDVVADGPAARAGLRAGDWIYAVNGVDCHRSDAAAVTALLTSTRSRSLELTLRRDGEGYQASVKSELVNSPCVRNVSILDETHHIGFLRISGFDFDTAMELRRSMDDLTRHGVKGLIIDLRCNGGGVMNAAIESARLFLDSGTIVTVVNAGERTRYCAGGSGKALEIPLALLVDKNTASAAEIFTAALRDNGRAVVIGEKTYGKARIQTIYPLPQSRLAACLTTAGYLPPANDDFNQRGLVPDICIENTVADIDTPLCASDLIRRDNFCMQTALQMLIFRGAL